MRLRPQSCEVTNNPGFTPLPSNLVIWSITVALLEKTTESLKSPILSGVKKILKFNWKPGFKTRGSFSVICGKSVLKGCLTAL